MRLAYLLAHDDDPHCLSTPSSVNLPVVEHDPGQPCMTEIHLHIVARMADYMRLLVGSGRAWLVVLEFGGFEQVWASGGRGGG